jgi:hypothetical protein
MVAKWLSSLFGIKPQLGRVPPDEPVPIKIQGSRPVRAFKPHKPFRAHRASSHGVALDAFIDAIRTRIPNTCLTVRVQGKAAHLTNKQLRRGGELSQFPTLDEPTHQYWIRFMIDPAPLGLEALIPHEPVGASQEYFKHRFDAVTAKMRTTLANCVDPKEARFTTRVSVGSDGYRLTLVAELRVGVLDMLSHCQTNLSDLGRANLIEIAREMHELVIARGISVKELYDNEALRLEWVRVAEDRWRRLRGLNPVGEGFVCETLLFQIVKARFSGTCREYSPTWLGRQRLDIFIPELQTAIEYHGEQHYIPIDRFGGADKFAEAQLRDKTKARLCRQNNIKLIIWPYTKAVTPEAVDLLLRSLTKGSMADAAGPGF